MQSRLGNLDSRTDVERRKRLAGCMAVYRPIVGKSDLLGAPRQSGTEPRDLASMP